MDISELEERRAAPLMATATVRLYVIAVVVTAAMTIAAVMALAIVVPNNTAVIATVIGISMPIIAGFLGGAVHGTAVALDGKLSMFMKTVAAKEHAEGVIQGLKENPKTNIGDSEG